MPHIRDGHMERMNETIRQVTVIREGLAQVEEEIKHHKGSKVPHRTAPHLLPALVL